MLGAAVTITAPAVEPIDLGEARDWLRLATNDLDRQVDQLIAAARLDLEGTTGQRLINQTVRLRGTCFDDLMRLPIGPVNEIVEIRYRDLNGVEQVLSPGLYELVGDRLDPGVAPIPGTVLPARRLGPNAVSITLSVGYGPTGAAVPQNLRWALLALIRGKFEDKPVDIDPLVVNERIYG